MGEGSSRGSDLQVNDEYGGDPERDEKEGIVEEEVEKKKKLKRSKKKKRRDCWMKKRDGRRPKREGNMSIYMPHRYLFNTKWWKSNCKESSVNYLSI